MNDVGALTREMTLLLQRAEAQLRHRDSMTRIDQGWATMQAGLQATADMLRLNAERFDPEWPDVAGADYVKRLQRSAATVQAWHQTLVSVDMPQTLTTLAGEIDVTFQSITQLKKVFDHLVAHLAALAYGPFVDPAMAAQMTTIVDMIVDRLRQLVDEARERLLRLDQTFLDAARRVSGAPDGAPWDGPKAVDTGTTGAAGDATTAAGGPGGPGGPGSGGLTMSASTGSAGAADPAGTGSGVAMSGDPGMATAPGGGAAVPQSGRHVGGAVAPAGLGSAPAGGAWAPGLAGLPAPTPVGGPPVIGPPSTPSIQTAASLTVPPLMPSAVPGAGVPGALGHPGSSRPRTGGIGHVPKPALGPASATIARAGAPIGTPIMPVSPLPPPPPSVEVGTPEGAGAGTTRPPMGVMPPMVGGAGTGSAPKAGMADDPNGGHRSRPLRAVPGVPFRLRDRAGSLDGATFLGAGRRPAPAPRDGHLDGAPAQPLDDELWKVDQSDTSP